MTKVYPTRLNNGAVVSGKLGTYNGQPTLSPYHFANRTQAEAHAAKVGGWVWRGTGRPFYVRLDAQEG